MGHKSISTFPAFISYILLGGLHGGLHGGLLLPTFISYFRGKAEGALPGIR